MSQIGCGSSIFQNSKRSDSEMRGVGSHYGAPKILPERKQSSIYNEQPERDSLNGPSSVPEREGVSDTPIDVGKPGNGGRHKLRGGAGGSGGRRTFLGLLSGRASDMLEHTEPL
ncbi:uncharacterized protein LOC142332507 [Lycorma delicatula]|uniref:uncharacterized protein LOC142332507 n=1 Tax=Lycorma delicatula TaxID=130591 RepID=UPI003F50E7A8